MRWVNSFVPWAGYDRPPYLLPVLPRASQMFFRFATKSNLLSTQKVQASVRGRIGIALHLSSAVDGTQVLQLNASSRELLAQCGHLVLQPARGGHQFGAALADSMAMLAIASSTTCCALRRAIPTSPKPPLNPVSARVTSTETLRFSVARPPCLQRSTCAMRDRVAGEQD